jgi:hypothetical protein
MICVFLLNSFTRGNFVKARLALVLCLQRKKKNALLLNQDLYLKNSLNNVLTKILKILTYEVGNIFH